MGDLNSVYPALRVWKEKLGDAPIPFGAKPLSNTRSFGLYANALIINAGRITSYMLADAVVGALGAGAFGVLDRSMVYIVLRWAAAVSLGWVGLSMTGFAPFPAAVYRAVSAASTGIATAARTLRLPQQLNFYVAGALWGFFLAPWSTRLCSTP